MRDFFEGLSERQLKYKKLYKNKPNLAAIKLSVWAFQQIFKRFSYYKENNNNKLNICFILEGGIGDTLVALNYIKYFYDYIDSKNICIDVYAFSSNTLIDAFISNQNYVSNAYIKQDALNNLHKYDVKIEIVRFPEIIINNFKKVRTYAPKILDMYYIYKNFYEENLRIFTEKPFFDCSANNMALAQNKNRVQMPDINNILNIDKKYKINLTICNEKETLNKFGLSNNKFITLNREVGTWTVSKFSTKMWNLENYIKLILLIKARFPKFKIVQLGTSFQRSTLISNVDINLVGKTSPEELKVLLKNSTLHIDGEGGLPHLREILTQKPSAVLFTSTDSRVFGYENNFNLKAENACNISCEWVIEDWQSKCLRGFENPPCSAKLKPEYVFEKIKDYLQENYIDN